ncbi:MAG TPA: Flp pilus assembly protein CpaB [Magnetospirillum sp.]|jgi:pilus assembly protein CpaB|nr:Flp pilus assembly protein CpaB [Magnetospirillum sp.]
MNVRAALRIVSIFVLAVVAALLLRGLFIASTSAPAAPPMNAVQTAAARLPVGTLLKADDLAWRDEPADAVKKGEIVRGSPAAHKLAGAVVRRVLDEGATITEKDVVFPDAPGFLAAALQPDMRAVSVAIDEVSGNAGLILPGDRVDLLLTHNLRDSEIGAQGTPKVATETVLADVRIIAVGSTLRAPEGDTPAAATANRARTVTLEVTARDGETVAVASRLGQLSLALRSLAVSRAKDGADAPAPAQPIWGRDISQVVRMADVPAKSHYQPVAAGPASVKVFRGAGESK